MRSAGVPFCLPVTSGSLGDVERLLWERRDTFHYVEAWLEHLTGVTPAALRRLAGEHGGRLVVLLRRRGLEPPKLPFSERCELIAALAGSAALLDLDIVAQEAELSFAATLKAPPPLLLSFHDYEQTPGDDELRAILTRMRARRPHLIKIATRCRERRDALRLLTLQVEILGREPAVIIGMGEEGRLTRLTGALWGNAMNFAPERPGQASAPGQFLREELLDLVNRCTGVGHGR